MKKENETSRLAQYFLNTCFSKSTVSKVSAYSSKHSMARTLSEQRTIYLAQTEAAITKLNECSNIYQVQTLLRKLPLEVQYFVSERAIVLSTMSQYHDRLTLDASEHADSFPQKIALLLQRLWEEHLHHLNEEGQSIDNNLSYIFHGRL